MEPGEVETVDSKDKLKAISCIPLPLFASFDIWIWSATRHGVYNVKSGYFVARSQLDVRYSGAASSSFVCPEGLWKMI